ncbi:MAG: DUF342 domain-containing protein [Candidatus Lambdaproteobacteria bacterium]|nr:DUF342 domain-containing protein [Candidatus Lambdaproteobacteria bacterium]
MEKHFELKVAGSQVLLRVPPPEKGKRANLNDIQKELQALGANFRHDNLFEVFRRASNEFEPVGVRQATAYEVLVNVSDDTQEAYLTVIPPDSANATLQPAKLKDALEAAKIEKGILYDEIKRVLLEKIEGQPVLIAKGKQPVQGQDGYIQFYGKGDENVAVEINRVDYKELNMIDNVEEGDLVARVVPPTHAEDGYNVYGRELKGHVGKPAKIKVGRNVKRSEEGTEVFSTKAGFIVVSGNKVSVEDIMRVKDVDSSTGNIRFTGVVQVTGQVMDGFTVEAGHGIQVSGTVGRATLKCRGDVKVSRGVLGSTIVADGNVHALFFSEASVEAGGDVEAEEYILHSRVQAGRCVRVKKPRTGFITGGLVQAGWLVQAPNLGSDVSEEQTQIEVGVGLGIKQRFDALVKKINLERASFEKIARQLLLLQGQREKHGSLPQDKQVTLNKMSLAAVNFQAELAGNLRPYHKLIRLLEKTGEVEPLVLVEHVINAGTSVQLNRQRVTITDPMEYCAFRVIDGQMKMRDYKEGERAQKMHQSRQVQGAPPTEQTHG